MFNRLMRSILFVFVMAFAGVAQAGDVSDGLKQDLANFFGVEKDRLYIECPQQTYKLEQGGQVLNMCLHKSDNQKRCEIAIHRLSRAPLKNKISYDINFADTDEWDRWLSVMQFHGFPDKGEEWRCPFAALEIEDGKFHMFNRWDASPISRVSGNHCTEPGSSITARRIFDDVMVTPGQWQPVEINTKLSYEDDGEFQVSVDGVKTPLIKGPNIYNDRRENFLKFGIYNPAGWEKGHVMSCVKYRNVKISTDLKE